MSAPAVAVPGIARVRRSPGLVGLKREGAIAPILAFVLFFVIYVAINPELLTRFQLQTAANLVAPLALVALGQLLVVLVGGIDISVAAVMSLANVVFATQLESMSPLVAGLMAIGVGMGCGLFNGLLAAYGRLPTIAVTLAASFIFGSLANEVLDRPGGAVSEDVTLATSGELAPYVPVALVWVLVAAALLWLLLQKTALGRHIYGAGSNAEGMRAAGLNDRLATLSAFVIAGALVALGGILLAGSTATGDPKSGDPYLLNAIAAVALAGASFTGGRGSVVGTICAAAILGLVGNVLFFAGVDSYWQYVVGSVIIVAVVGVPVVVGRLRTRLKGASA
jgi:ribose transport system permease protein